MKLSEVGSAPSWVVFQLLEKCNLRCRMCYEWGETGAYHGREHAAMLELPIVLHTVEECLPTRPTFEFFGGEPLLYPGIYDVIERIRAGGCEVSFPTNGTLLKAEAERLVETAPTRLWVSVDGPAAVNDAQRGRGVFDQVIRGIETLIRARDRRGSTLPELGITYVVTPTNHHCVEQFFREAIDISTLAGVSIELQSYATAAQVRDYARELRAEFGVLSTPCADAYIRDPADFAEIDFVHLTNQLVAVRDACVEHTILFHSQPQTLEVDNLRDYFTANWDAMTDKRSRCGVPWVSAEISARGDVTTCHTFYDLPLGNIREQSLLEIWRGPRLKQLRERLRNGLFPICTACCRYYGGAGSLTVPRGPDG